jgi:hypothetical protein
MTCIFAIDRHGKTGAPIITARWNDRASFRNDPKGSIVKANGFRWYASGGFWYTTNLHNGRSVAAAYGVTLPASTPDVPAVPTPTPIPTPTRTAPAPKTREFAPQSHVGQAIREAESRGKSAEECLEDILRSVAAAKSRQRRTIKLDDLLAAMTR